MAYGDLPMDAPEKPNKGVEGGACNRRSCQAEPAIGIITEASRGIAALVDIRLNSRIFVTGKSIGNHGLVIRCSKLAR